MQLKYYYTFKSTSKNYRVEILENTLDQITSKEIKNTTTGFILKSVDTDSKIVNVIGTAANFTILSPKSFEYIDLLTPEIQKYCVVLYENNIAIWSGWLNTEYYQEDFAISSKIDLDFTAADFNILERIKWLKEDGSIYSDNMSYYNIIKTIFDKLQLPFKNLFIGIATTSEDFTINTNDTLLHNLYSNWKNFYDEDLVAMNCREVLDTILTPFSLSIKQVENSFYIYDLETIQSTLPTFKKYSNSFAYIGSESIVCNKGDISIIKPNSNDITYNSIPAYNRVKLAYNRYRIDSIAKSSIGDKDLNNFKAVEHHIDIGDNNENYNYDKNNYYNCKTFTNLTSLGDNVNYCELIGTGEYSKYKDKIYGISYDDTTLTNSTLIKITKPLPYIISIDKYRLQLDVKLRLGTNITYFSPSKSIDATILGQAYLPIVIYIDSGIVNATDAACNNIMFYTNNSYFFGTGSYGWVSSTINRTTKEIAKYEKAYIPYYNNDKTGSIANTWLNPVPLRWRNTEFKENPPEINEKNFTIPMPNYSGSLNFFVQSGVKLYTNKGVVYSKSLVPYMINDFDFKLVDTNFLEINQDDIEYNSYIDKRYKDNADEIETKQGTNIDVYPLENAAILYKKTDNTFGYVNKFRRAGVIEIIEKLNLRTYMSNYMTNSVKLELDLNNTFTPFGFLTYNKYLPNTNLGIYSYEIDFEDDNVHITTMQIYKDNININNIDYEYN